MLWHTSQEFKCSSGQNKRVATSLLFLFHLERRKVWDVIEGPSCPVQISQNHRMLWVAQDLEDDLVPTKLGMGRIFRGPSKPNRSIFCDSLMRRFNSFPPSPVLSHLWIRGLMILLHHPGCYTNNLAWVAENAALGLARALRAESPEHFPRLLGDSDSPEIRQWHSP